MKCPNCGVEMRRRIAQVNPVEYLGSFYCQRCDDLDEELEDEDGE